MKEPLDTPTEPLVRATLFATLGAVALGVLLTIAGVVVWRLEWSLLGMGVLGAACAGRAWLQRRGDFASRERVLEALWEDAPEPDEGRAARLMALLEQWEAMEQKRGSAEFDPWALQTVRNEIRLVVESDPALEQLFERLRQAA